MSNQPLWQGFGCVIWTEAREIGQTPTFQDFVIADSAPAASVETAIARQKFGVGQPVLRKEDDTLVRGKGKYTDDFNLSGQAYAWIGRASPAPRTHHGHHT